MAAHRPPAACPVCGDALVTTRLGCHGCGTELVGTFAPCAFCSLQEADQDLLRVFLVSRGNLKEVEKYLGVSYPTARARFNDLLERLGLLGFADPEDAAASSDAPRPSDAEPTEEESTEEAPSEATGAGGAGTHEAPGAEASGGDAIRDQVLAQVASGVLSPAVAADLLGRLR